MMTFFAILAAWMYVKLATLMVFLWAGLALAVATAFGMAMTYDMNNGYNKESEDKTNSRAFATKYLKKAMKYGITFAILIFVIPTQDQLKVIAATGGVVWAVQDEDVQKVAKEVVTGAKDIAVGMVTQVASAAKGSGDTMDLANQLLQKTIKDQLNAK